MERIYAVTHEAYMAGVSDDPELAVREMAERREEGAVSDVSDIWPPKFCPMCGAPRDEDDEPGESLTAAQTALRTAETLVAVRRQELQAAVLQARENRSLADIARELGVSKQRVQQISEGK